MDNTKIWATQNLKNMVKIEARDIAPLATHWAKTAISLANEGQEVAPQVFLVQLKPETMVAAIEPETVWRWHTAGHAREAASALASFFDASSPNVQQLKHQGFEVQALVRIFEAWVAVPQTPQELQALKDGVRPSEMATRREAIVLEIRTAYDTWIWPHFYFEHEGRRECIFSDFPEEADLSGLALLD
jgi:hypothetical protein